MVRTQSTYGVPGIKAVRTALCLAFVLVLLAASVHAAGGAAAGQAQAQPKYGGTFSLPITDDPPMWPVKGGIYNILVNKVLYDTLIRYDWDNLELVGSLAESWSVSKDGLTYTFNLRRNVKWHDGQPFTSADVKFTFDTWTNIEVPYYLSANVSNVNGVEAVGPYTIKVYMKAPTASFPVLLGYNMCILPKHLLEKYSIKDLANPVEFLKRPIGTGPFKFAQKAPGSFVRLVANEDYFDGKPYLDAIVFKVVPDVDTQMAQVLAGDLDFAIVEPHQLQAVKGAPGVRIDEAKQVNHFYIDLNNLKPYFKDKRVRQALTYGLDRQKIVDSVLMGMAKVATGPISPEIKWAYNPNVKAYPYDLAKANALLDEAGWIRGPDGIRQKDGVRLSFVIEVDPHPVRQQIAVVAKDNWAKLGVEAKIQLFEYNVILKHARDNPPTYDANPNWLITPPDPDISTYYMSTSGGNTSEYANPELDRLLEQGRSTPDKEERRKIYFKIQELIAEECPIVYLYYPKELRLISEKVGWFAPVGYRDALAWSHKIWKK